MERKPKILLVDDEPSIINTLGPLLGSFDFTIATASDGPEALEQVAAFQPDLIVLDVMMPTMDGREVLRQLRRRGNRTPVILLTKIGESTERALALEEGADDYLNKPCDPFELLARIRAVLRRISPGSLSPASASKLVSGELTLDRQARRVYLGTKELVLQAQTVTLLEYLLCHPGEVLSRERLLDAVWGWDYVAGTRAVDNQVYRLRQSLDDTRAEPRYIETVPGQGYRFIGPVEIVP